MLREPSDVYVVEYSQALEFCKTQEKVLWFADEIKADKDVHDILVNMTEAERHGVITTLKLFTQYELIVGDDYWQRVMGMFQKPACVSRMANMFSFVELNVHAPFYAKINEALGLANEKFYTEYLDDPVLKDRISMLEGYANADHIPTMLMSLAFAEGVILYSNFAFLKHFQSNGKNKLVNIVRGINMSARDENLHSEASAWLFRTLREENQIPEDALIGELNEMAELVREHEYAIVDKIFEKGPIEGITDVQMKHFIDSRINLVARNLGFKNLYEVKYNPIRAWFEEGIDQFQFNDFFSGMGREYTRQWEQTEFDW